jgi:hypothetical protein
MAKSSESADAPETADSFRNAVDSSLIAGTLRRTNDAIETATDTAATTGALATVGQWTRQSFLYRWLTAEPDPDVVVIDLRETYTVGPLLAVLDWTVERLKRYGQQSAVTHAGVDLYSTAARAPIRLAGIVLTVAILANLLLTVALGTLSTTGAVIRGLALALALLATRIRVPWDQIRESRTARVVRALLEPPDPPEE